MQNRVSTEKPTALIANNFMVERDANDVPRILAEGGPSRATSQTRSVAEAGPRAELYLKRKLKLSQIRMRMAIKAEMGKNQNKLLSETSSLNFSVYKRKQVSDMAKEIEPQIKEEIAPIRNMTNSLIPSRFSIQNAT